MKPSIPEIAIVIKLQGDFATVMLKGGESCKGCGQARIGLCRASSTNMILKVKNPIGARVGDTVTIGVSKITKTKGYFLAFIVPLIFLVLGTSIGHIISRRFLIPSLDVIGGFIALFLASLFSFRRLKILDSSSSMVIQSVLSDNIFTDSVEPDEMRLYSKYLF